MPPLVSVITCTHNPREDYLERVLAALKAQSLGLEQWEYIVVDNASADPLEKRVSLCWHPLAKCVREEQLGLTHARIRGIRESAGELLVFVDDDNVLDADYLEQALRIAREWPILGVWGGQTRPYFESPPEEWTKQFWGRLAVREIEQDRWSNQHDQHSAMPFGAGMCVRRSVAAHYAELHTSGQRRIMLDRTGHSLVSGGDCDLAMCACDIGLGMGLFKSLRLIHLIPRNRLTEEYLVRLVEGLAYSGIVLNSFRSPECRPSSRRWSSAVADFMRLLIRGRRQRRFFQAVKKGERAAWQHLSEIECGRR